MRRWRSQQRLVDRARCWLGAEHVRHKVLHSSPATSPATKKQMAALCATVHLSICFVSSSSSGVRGASCPSSTTSPSATLRAAFFLRSSESWWVSFLIFCLVSLTTTPVCLACFPQDTMAVETPEGRHTMVVRVAAQPAGLFHLLLHRLRVRHNLRPANDHACGHLAANEIR